ncbi:MAG: tRNA (adenosine(37)-N6)-threonylcarbamoyltransferase complex ATPase subunit type 1 TsaE, partial [Parcubacteria group bacterium CG23_combo_of_CG06-09_8_20_14_all_35_6]
TTLRRGEIEILETKSNSFISDSEEKTKEIAKKIIKKYSKLLSRKALIFALQGELGSGKTQFAKGLGSFLKIKENIISPTFVIIREYPFKLEKKQGIFFHLDTWRLEKGEELLDLGLKKMFEPGNVIAIEWLQKIKPILDNLQRQNKIKLTWISIKYLTETKRKINYK